MVAFGLTIIQDYHSNPRFVHALITAVNVLVSKFVSLGVLAVFCHPILLTNIQFAFLQSPYILPIVQPFAWLESSVNSSQFLMFLACPHYENTFCFSFLSHGHNPAHSERTLCDLFVRLNLLIIRLWHSVSDNR